ncbi:hypothetical protein HUN08_07020 [Gordonia sp. X0973]|uniref:hypothetical protein n=1 Tax=Gordonia sp. X0973 TaxID=2742602 RepID=UPI000F536B10|nr:hypothetical protein [Gordonia sp. X0973]QKT06970.1 hypothetical protein HUN08_07020 [Gordonia sp. X0973]
MSEHKTLGNLADDFHSLSTRAGNGEMTFDSAAASKAVVACNEYIAKMRDLSRTIANLKSLDGFGGFGTSIEAKEFYDIQSKKWAQQASDCADVAKSMADAFEAAAKCIVTQEQINQSHIAGSGPH